MSMGATVNHKTADNHWLSFTGYNNWLSFNNSYLLQTWDQDLVIMLIEDGNIGDIGLNIKSLKI